MNAKIKTNNHNDDLYCCDCKNYIRIGEKYVVVEEEIYGEENVVKEYHTECSPSEDEEDEVFIVKEEE